MGSTFVGFETARRAMAMNRLGTEVVANNIANANTKGYSRRTVQLATTTSLEVATMHNRTAQVGTGVDLQAVVREGSDYADSVVRRELGSSARTGVQLAASDSIQMSLLEPSDSGLQEVLSSFWNAWNEVAKRPEDAGIRSALLERGKALADSVRYLATSFDSVVPEEVSGLGQDVVKLNDVSQRVAELNKQIVEAIGVRVNPSDFIDQRAALIDDMASLVDVAVMSNEDGSVSVLGGGRWLVDGARSSTVTLETRAADGQLSLETPQGDVFTPVGGSVGGRIALVNTVIPGYRRQLSSFARDLREGVNSLHRQGFPNLGTTTPVAGQNDGKDFFMTPAPGADDASSLEVTLNAPGDVACNTVDFGPPVLVHYGAMADRIEDLRTANVVYADGTSGGVLLDEYIGLVSSVGHGVELLQRDKDISDVLLEQGLNSRDELSGVATDEEMMDMLKYEAGYNAAARVVSMVDEMLQTILGLIR